MFFFISLSNLCILFEFIQIFSIIQEFFIDHPYNQPFESFIWDFTYFAFIRVHFCAVAMFWRNHAALLFHIFFCFCIGISAFDAKLLVANFHPWYTLSLIFSVWDGGGRVEMQFLTTELEVSLHDYNLSMCSMHGPDPSTTLMDKN
jgi:hypothetical protein